MICQSAWTTLFNVRRVSLATIKPRAEGTRSMIHGNKGKSFVSEENKQAYKHIDDKLTSLRNDYLEPHSSRLVRNAAGQTTVDEDDREYLPPCFCKRQCYRNICYEAGYQVKMKCHSKGIFERVKDWELRPHFYRTQAELDAVADPDGQVAIPIISWTSFLRYWVQHFPKLVVHSKGEDTCADCHFFQ